MMSFTPAGEPRKGSWAARNIRRSSGSNIANSFPFARAVAHGGGGKNPGSGGTVVGRYPVAGAGPESSHAPVDRPHVAQREHLQSIGYFTYLRRPAAARGARGGPLTLLGGAPRTPGSGRVWRGGRSRRRGRRRRALVAFGPTVQAGVWPRGAAAPKPGRERSLCRRQKPARLRGRLGM